MKNLVVCWEKFNMEVGKNIKEISGVRNFRDTANQEQFDLKSINAYLFKI